MQRDAYAKVADETFIHARHLVHSISQPSRVKSSLACQSQCISNLVSKVKAKKVSAIPLSIFRFKSISDNTIDIGKVVSAILDTSMLTSLGEWLHGRHFGQVQHH